MVRRTGGLCTANIQLKFRISCIRQLKAIKIKQSMNKIISHGFSSLYHKIDLFRNGESFSFSLEFSEKKYSKKCDSMKNLVIILGKHNHKSKIMQRELLKNAYRKYEFTC